MARQMTALNPSTAVQSAPNAAVVTPTADRFVFVGGLHRSGTTQVARLLATHPETSGLTETGVTEDEGHYLHDVYPSVSEFGGPGRFAWDERSHLIETSSSTDRASIEAAWAPHWSQVDARVRIEKSPQTLLQGRYLQSVFPGAQFVMVLRNPVAVALATSKWTSFGRSAIRLRRRPLSLEDLVRHWLRAHEVFLADVPYLDHVQVVRFEDVMNEPETTLGLVSNTLGLEPDFDLDGFTKSERTYDAQWQQWLDTKAGKRAAQTWLPGVDEQIAKWGYSTSDPLV